MRIPQPYRAGSVRGVSLLIAGSIATDHLMSFPGKFADSLVVDQLDKLSVSFLVEDLEVRRGGCAANICFGLGNLGLRPVLVGAVGEDFAEYRSWLERHNVDCDSVHVSRDPAHRPLRVHQRLRARPDRQLLRRRDERGPRDRAQADRRPRRRRPTTSSSAPTTRRGCCATPRSAASAATAFVADPSQQLAFGDGDLIRPLIDGADILFSNEYEASADHPEDRLEPRGGPRPRRHLGGHPRRRRASGSTARARSRSSSRAVPEIEKVEPTGVGDAFRAGFLAALSWGLGHERAAQLGCLLAVYVVEQVGTQEYTLSRAAFLAALRGDLRRRGRSRRRAAPAAPSGP